MACSCISDWDARLAERNTRLKVMIVYGHDRSLEAFPAIGTEQIEKGRWKPKACGVVPTFCPFCGEPYKPLPAKPRAKQEGA